jgi:uncharacterized protein (DUF952 family)
MTAPRLFRLIDGAVWAQAKAAGSAAALPLNDDDRRDGFLHLSGRDQVAETARRYYASVPDLWVLEIDPGALGEALRWEVSRGGALFPHVYGPAPLAAVIEAKPYDSRDFP